MLDNLTPKSYLTLNSHNVRNFFHIKNPPQPNEMACIKNAMKKID